MARIAIPLTLSVVLSLGSDAQACRDARSVTTAEFHAKSCAWKNPSYLPACERLSTDPSPLIFSAVVEKVSPEDGQLVVDGECLKTSLQTVVLRRIETFRGQVPDKITLQAGDLNGFYFNSRRSYLVFAYTRADGQITVDGYCQTRELKHAQEDVAYLRTYARRLELGDIFGHAWRAVNRLNERRMSIPREKPMVGVDLSLSGAVERHTKVDASGQYRFRALPPGEYTLEIHSGPNIVWGAKRKVSVAPKGCAKIDFDELPYNPEIVKNSFQPDGLCPAQSR